jgi:hypothetical protein
MGSKMSVSTASPITAICTTANYSNLHSSQLQQSAQQRRCSNVGEFRQIMPHARTPWTRRRQRQRICVDCYTFTQSQRKHNAHSTVKLAGHPYLVHELQAGEPRWRHDAGTTMMMRCEWKHRGWSRGEKERTSSLSCSGRQASAAWAEQCQCCRPEIPSLRWPIWWGRRAE